MLRRIKIWVGGIGESLRVSICCWTACLPTLAPALTCIACVLTYWNAYVPIFVADSNNWCPYVVLVCKCRSGQRAALTAEAMQGAHPLWDTWCSKWLVRQSRNFPKQNRKKGMQQQGPFQRHSSVAALFCFMPISCSGWLATFKQEIFWEDILHLFYKRDLWLV